MMLHQEKELPNDPGRPLSYNNFTDKKVKWLLLRSSVFFFCVFYIELSLHLTSLGFTNDNKKNCSSVNKYQYSRHSNLNFAHHFVTY